MTIQIRPTLSHPHLYGTDLKSHISQTEPLDAEIVRLTAALRNISVAVFFWLTSLDVATLGISSLYFVCLGAAAIFALWALALFGGWVRDLCNRKSLGLSIGFGAASFAGVMRSFFGTGSPDALILAYLMMTGLCVTHVVTALWPRLS